MSFEDDAETFLKFHGATVNDDWIRVNILADLAKNVPGLSAPQPIKADSDKQHIHYEHLGNLPVLPIYDGSATRERLFNIGELLATLHLSSVKTETVRSLKNAEPLNTQGFGLEKDEADQLDASIPTTFFHGDCWHGNFLIQNDVVVIIDPIPSDFMFGRRRYMRANGAIDIATLYMSLLISHPTHRLLRLRQQEQLNAANALLEGYLGIIGNSALYPLIVKVSRSIAIRYLSSYPKRINPIIGHAKKLLSHRLINEFDKIIG